MLNLDPRIDLDKVELVGVGIKKKFDGSCAVVAHFAPDGECSFVQLRGDLFGEVRSGCQFHNLLVAALH